MQSIMIATFSAAVLVAHAVSAKAARDGLLVGTFGADWLPRAMIGAAAVSIVAAVLSAHAMARWGARRVLTVALLLGASGYVVEWALVERLPGGVALALYLHVTALGAILLPAFWSILSDSFDPRSAKRRIARIAGGGTLGGVAGGSLTWALGATGSVSTLLLLLSGLSVLAAALARRVSTAPARRASAQSDTDLGGHATHQPFLLRLGLLVGLGAMASALLDYALAARAEPMFHDAGSLASFFAVFHMGVGLSAFAVQTLAARRVLERWGLSGAVALAPVLVVVGGLAAFWSATLWSMLALRGVEGVARGSVHRSGYELMYTPLSADSKQSAKMLIDVGVDRVGTIAGSGLSVLAIALQPHAASAVSVAFAMMASLVALLVIPGLQRGYVQALAHSLQTGSVALSPDRIFDATTRRTLAETTAIDRRKLLIAIEQHRSTPPERQRAPDDERAPRFLIADTGFDVAPASMRFEEQAERNVSDRLLQKVADLRSDDRARILATLAERPLERDLVAHVIGLLARDDVARAALDALRDRADSITGQLSDAIADRSLPVAVRRRLPRVLEVCANPRAAHALVDGLHDSAFEVRYQSALALSRFGAEHPAVELPRERILKSALQEVQRGAESWQRYTTVDGDEHDSPWLDSALRARAGRGVELVMLILSVVLEREPLRLAFRALFSDDAALRGTALEYLDNVLPEPIKRAGMPFLDDLDRVQHKKRAHSEVVEALLRSGETHIDPSRLKIILDSK